MNTYLRKYLFFGILFLITGFLLGQSFQLSLDEQGLENDEQAVEDVKLMIDYGDGKVETFSGISGVQANALSVLKEKKGDAVRTQSFAGFDSVLVSAIDGKANDGDFYWQYWVNFEYGKVGAELYQLSPGDLVEWKFTSEQPLQ